MSEEAKEPEIQPKGQEASTHSSMENATAATQPETGTPTEHPTEETAAFDAASFEQDYGMPEGALADAKDEQSALELVRQHADKLLTAGFANSASQQSDNAGKETGGTANTQKEQPSSGNEEIDKLRAKLETVESKLEQQEKQRFDAAFQEVSRRAIEEIDKWDTEKYGKTGQRSYNQMKAVRELEELYSTHLAGYTTQGKNPPTIEAVMRQIRAFHDDSGSKKSGSENKKEKPLGTPGTSRSPGGSDNEPRSIHHAFTGMK